MKQCPVCYYENKDNTKFCVNCGTKLGNDKYCCPECGYESKSLVKFCTSCGYKFGDVSAMSLTVQEKSESSVLLDYESVSDKVALSNFGLISWYDFVQSQKFENLEAEQAFKALFSYFMFLSDLYNNSDDFIRKRFEEVHIQLIGQIPRNLLEKGKKDIANVVSLMKKRLFKNKIDYRWLFVAEIIYTYRILNVDFKEENSDYSRLWDFLEIRKEKKINMILYSVDNPDAIKNKWIKSSFNDFTSFVSAQQKYLSLKVFNIAVCATMSAGKSTFVNALLGADYLPSRNEATTACITSVYDNDSLQKMIGFAERKNKTLEGANSLVLANIDKWNSDENVRHIYLQSDLDDISSTKVICAVHDTPGTNNSGDNSHHDITMDFLNSTKIDAIIFVVNAEHISTTDEKTLLSEIYKNKISKDKTPIMFALNKADCIDNEKEDISEIIRKYKDYLNTIGFDNPKVYPVSAKAARLLKMVSKEKGNNFSKMEQREFALCLSEFLEDYDFSSTNEETNYVDSMITVGQKEFSKNEILKALNRTGINAIEKEIESLF